MRSSIAITALVVICANPARADRLDDLVARMDRLERENAELRRELRATRARGASARTASIYRPPDSTPGIASVFVPARPASGFDGTYVAAVGGGNTRSARNGAPGNSLGYNFQTNTSFQTELPPNGTFGGISVGYGETIGSLYVGVDARGILKDQSDSVSGQTGSSNRSLPITIGSGCCFGGQGNFPFPPLSQTGPIILSSLQVVKGTVSDKGGADLALRVGFLPFDDLLIYGRVGAGASFIDSRVRGGTYQTNCINPIVQRTIIFNSSFADNAIGCQQLSSTPQVNKARYSSEFTPYITTGGGVEKSFGSFFVRADADLVTFVGSAFANTSPITGNRQSTLSLAPYYEVRASGAVGYRW